MSKKTRKFKTEVQQLLDLVIHSLYSKKEIYLRELISNASDAIDRLKFEALTNASLLHGELNGRILIRLDKKARTITLSDNGIGMTADEVEENIGTIAHSGTRQFLQSVKESGKPLTPELIGQFGVGFYSAFMAADKVVLRTRHAGADQQAVEWTSIGDGNYTLDDCEKTEHGTDIVLHIREGMDEFLEDWNVRQTVKQYSDFISYPVLLEVEGEEKKDDTPLNSMKSIWKRAKNEVTAEEHKEFYHHVSHDFADPLRIIHYSAEGTTEFKALLYIPGQAPFDLFWPEHRHGIQLYVRNVFITDHCKELIPEYLRFARGVVDSSDLPLNVSREMLQDDAIVRRIRKNLVSKILAELADLKKQSAEDYLKFWSAFGRVIKEGVHSDHDNHEKLTELLLFLSSKMDDGKPIDLKTYVERMPSGQKDIYYITGASLTTVQNSPLLENFKRRNYEVLFLTDPIDEWMVQRLTEYAGRKLVAIDRGEVKLGSEEEQKEEKEKIEKTASEYKDLFDFIRQRLDDSIKEVRLSTRLADSPCCLVTDEHALNPNMERLMRAMNQPIPSTKRILEINPAHPILPKMKALMESDRNGPALAETIDLLHAQALVSEGSPVPDPARFAKLLGDLLAKR